MDGTGLPILNLLFAALCWGSALWLFLNRNSPDRLSQKFPLIHRYRKHRLHPLFKDRADVLWFAAWPFLLGSVFVVALIVDLVRRSRL